MWSPLAFFRLSRGLDGRKRCWATCGEKSIFGSENIGKVECASTISNQIFRVIEVRARKVRDGRLQCRKSSHNLIVRVSDGYVLNAQLGVCFSDAPTLVKREDQPRKQSFSGDDAVTVRCLRHAHADVDFGG